MDNEPTVNYGIIGCGDNLIRKIIASSESTPGIRIISLADIYPSLFETFNQLKKRKNDDGSPMYTGKLEENMKKILDMEKSGLFHYFQVNGNGEIPEEFFYPLKNIPVHIVHISSPNDSHGHYSIRVAEHKVHILSEKPFEESYVDAVQTLFRINAAINGEKIAKISAVHYLRYGPSIEFLRNLERIITKAGPITEISADFVEDRTYLNERTKDQFKNRGAIHDMLVHYIAFVHKTGATIHSKANLNSTIGGTVTYTIPGYQNETAVLSAQGLSGPYFAPGAILLLKAVKGDSTNSKNINFRFKNDRFIRLSFCPGRLGILDSEVAMYGEKQWWDDAEIKIDPSQRNYLEGRDEVRRLSFGMNGGYKVSHTLEDAVKDLSVVDKIKTNSVKDPPENYYGMRYNLNN